MKRRMSLKWKLYTAYLLATFCLMVVLLFVGLFIDSSKPILISLSIAVFNTALTSWVGNPRHRPDFYVVGN